MYYIEHLGPKFFPNLVRYSREFVITEFDRILLLIFKLLMLIFLIKFLVPGIFARKKTEKSKHSFYS